MLVIMSVFFFSVSLYIKIIELIEKILPFWEKKKSLEKTKGTIIPGEI